MSLRYRPEIDGLRSLAVVPVVLYHLGSILPGGYIGVDVFFVISGFLITKLIIPEISKGSFSLTLFYMRRIFRLAPALFFVIGIIGITSLYMMPPLQLMQYSKSAIFALLFSSNIFFLHQGSDYFSGGLETQSLLHTWSLGIEAQFYLLISLLLTAIRGYPNRSIKWVMVALTALSFFFSLWAVEVARLSAFYLLPARIWEFGVGSLVALGVTPQPRTRAWREVISFSSLTAIALPIIFYGAATPFPGAAALPPVIGTAAFLVVSSSGPSFGKVALSSKLLVSIGRISYSLYLWHWPVIVLFRNLLGSDVLAPWAQLFAATLSLVLAYITWQYVERPFRRAGRFTRAQLFGALVAAGSMLTVGFGTIVALNGIPARFTPRELNVLAPIHDYSECAARPAEGDYCIIGSLGSQPTFALWGDSHAEVIAPAFASAARRMGRSGYLMYASSCPPLLGVNHPGRPTCRPFNTRSVQFLSKHRELKQVFMVSKWPLWKRDKGAPGRFGLGVGLVETDSSERWLNPDVFNRALYRTLSVIGGTRVTLIGDVPQIGWDVPSHLFAHARFGTPIPIGPSFASVRDGQAGTNIILAESARRAKGTFIDIGKYFCRPACLIENKGLSIYKDDNHLTASAARDLLTPVAERLLRGSQEAGPGRFGKASREVVRPLLQKNAVALPEADLPVGGGRPQTAPISRGQP